MLSDYKCPACGHVQEEWFPSSAKMSKTIPCKCGKEMKKVLFSSQHVGMGGEIPGYEKENQGKLTFGKGVDAKQAWV